MIYVGYQGVSKSTLVGKDNIIDLSKEKNKIVITNFNYNLKDLICG